MRDIGLPILGTILYTLIAGVLSIVLVVGIGVVVVGLSGLLSWLFVINLNPSWYGLVLDAYGDNLRLVAFGCMGIAPFLYYLDWKYQVWLYDPMANLPEY